MERQFHETNIIPFYYAVSLIGGKWRSVLIWKNNIMRYGELKWKLSGVTHKMLSAKLKELEVDGLIKDMNIRGAFQNRILFIRIRSDTHACVTGTLRLGNINVSRTIWRVTYTCINVKTDIFPKCIRKVLSQGLKEWDLKQNFKPLI